MFKEGFPIAYEAPAYLKKWPSVNNQRLNGKADLTWSSTARSRNAYGNCLQSR